MQRSMSSTSELDITSSPDPWHNEFSDTLSHGVDGDKWFEEIHRRFDERRKKWDDEVRRMRRDFFTYGPDHFRRSLTPPRLYVPKYKHHYIRPFSGKVEHASDGKPYFTAKFDLAGFTPEDIRVSIRDGEVLVNAKTEEITDDGKSSREYSRSVTLPVGADETLADATLTPQGLLTFTCPVQSQCTNSCVSKYKSELSPPSDSSDVNRSMDYAKKHTPLTYSSTRESMNVSSIDRRFCLEIPIGSDYSPAEINVRTINRRIHVTAKHTERQPNRTAVREFSKEYDIPDGIEPESLQARIQHGILYIESL